MIAVDKSDGQCDMGSIARDAQCRTTEMIKDNPGLSMLIVFGVGVGVGALLGEAVSLGTASRHMETTTERIGRQICDALHIKL